MRAKIVLAFETRFEDHKRSVVEDHLYRVGLYDR